MNKLFQKQSFQVHSNKWCSTSKMKHAVNSFYKGKREKYNNLITSLLTPAVHHRQRFSQD